MFMSQELLMDGSIRLSWLKGNKASNKMMSRK